MPGFWENLFGAGITAGGLALGAKAYDQLGETGERAYQEFAGEDGLANKLSGMLEFQPYTVTSATGGRFGMSRTQRRVKCRTTLLLLLKNRLSSSKP
jgi:hypothetical protein